MQIPIRALAAGALLALIGLGPSHGALVPTSYTLPFVPGAGSQPAGLVRIVSRSEEPGVVQIDAVDDAGTAYGPLKLDLPPWSLVQLSSQHLESGATAKGLTGALGDGEGHWRLTFSADVDIAVGAFVRPPIGGIASVHDVVPETLPGQHYTVAFFHPARNKRRSPSRRQSILRIVNVAAQPASVSISGRDGDGKPALDVVTLELDPGTATMLSASDLEQGSDLFKGRFGDGTGKWTLSVQSDRPVRVLSLLRSRAGGLTNLSSTALPDPDLLFHFVGCHAPDGFHGYLARGAAQASFDLGVDVRYVYPEERSVESQGALVREALEVGADGIVLCTFAPDEAYEPLVQYVYSTGLTAFASASAPQPGSYFRLPSDLFLFRTGADEGQAGELTARRLIDLQVHRQALISNHLPDDVTCEHRLRRQRLVLENTGVKVHVLSKPMTFAEQMQEVSAYLSKHPGIQSATSVCGSSEPILQAKAMLQRDDLVVTGYDLDAVSVEAIRSGRQAFTIDQQQLWRGYVPVVLLTHYLRYGLQPATHFLTGPRIVDARNIDEVAELVQGGYR